MNCPSCGFAEMEFIAGDYETGVVAPDGGRESRWEEGFYCPRCAQTFDAADLEDDEPVRDPDHLNPTEGGNRASDDYW